MKYGLERFEYFLNELDSLMQQASPEENPAWFLYKNNARTTLFMLEALCRIHVRIMGEKPFKKLGNQFKDLEDGIGQIDHYDHYGKKFFNKENIDAGIKQYLYNKNNESARLLNDKLVKEKWIGPGAGRIKKIKEKLSSLKWLKPKKEIKAIQDFYEETIEEVKSFYENYKNGFTEMEEQVHEMRRDVRWLSIYAHALRGSVQLIDSGVDEEDTRPFITPVTEQSPFTQLPDAQNLRYVMLLDKQAFLATSGLIDLLGNIKDEGLDILFVAEAVQQTRSVNTQTALQGAYEVLNYESNGMQKILNKANEVCKPFFDKAILARLVQGVATSVKN